MKRTDGPNFMNPREAAFLALLEAHQDSRFISDFLEEWRVKYNPTEKDERLAYEIALGTERRLLTLNFLALGLSTKGKLQLKAKERILLFLSIYQYVFMSRVPIFAIINEAVELAKRYCNSHFASFLNASLRKLPTAPLSLPFSDELSDISIQFSYPLAFVKMIIEEYGFKEGKRILETLNHPPPTFARHRPSFEMVPIINQQLKAVSSDLNYYIQNPTPCFLIKKLSEKIKTPFDILDLCSSPGGKLISIHDLFPEASLYANDLSELRIERLKQNLKKYQIEATISNWRGEEFPEDKKFDLVILDVPCTNSGVLHKRPEARWRIDEKAVFELTTTQLALIEKATKLLKINGQIWYMTCSVLNQENEQLINTAVIKFGLAVSQIHKMIPHEELDGGFACSLNLFRN